MDTPEISRIIPAIIPESLTHLRTMLDRVPFAPAVQVDVIDGIFAPQVSWPYGEGERAGDPMDVKADFSLFEIEIDLMVEKPEAHLDRWVSAGAQRIVVHIESTEYMDDIVTHADVHGYTLGIAFDDDTALDVVVPYLSRVGFVQCMGIDVVGAQGEPFEPRVLENIRALHTQFPNLLIQVDGSVNMETIVLLRDAGASRFIAGSAIMKAEHPQEAYEQLTHMMNT